MSWRIGSEESPGARAGLAVLLLAVAPPLHGETPVAADLVAVPLPMLDRLEGPIQKQLGEERENLERLIERQDLSREALGEGYGWMGQLYFLYELMEPAEACFLNARALLSERTLLKPKGKPTWRKYAQVLTALEEHGPAANAASRAEV